MKKNVFGLLTGIAISLMATGCYTNVFDETNTEYFLEQGCMVVVDENRETGYDCMLLAPEDGYVDLIKVYENENLEEIVIMYGEEYKDVAVMRFYEDGLLKSASADSLTIAFSNYVDNKVDVALIYKDNMSIIKEMELSDPSQTRSVNLERGLDFIVSQFKNIGQAAVDGALKLSSGEKIAFDLLFGIVSDAYRLFDENEISLMNFAINTVSVAEVTAALIPVFSAAANASPWLGLATLLLNFDDYVDWVASLSYSVISILDKYISNEELGVCSLNSGYGALKATLSWSFYADIDLHAIEPSGEHIYYADKWSSTGGYLDVDNREGGSGSQENVYWENPENGTYSFYIDYYSPSTYNGMAQSGICRVAILYQGQSIGVHNISMTEDDTKDAQTININGGIGTKADAPDINIKLIINHKERKN